MDGRRADDRRAARLREDLLDLGVTAVMSRATTLGDTLVVPSHVVLTLRAADLAAVDSAQVGAELAVAVRAAVRGRCAGDVAVIGDVDLRVSVVVGDVREADARFESLEAGNGSRKGSTGAGPDRAGSGADRVVDDPRQPFEPFEPFRRSVP